MPKKEYLCQGGPFDGRTLIFDNDLDVTTAVFNLRGSGIHGRYVRKSDKMIVEWEIINDENGRETHRKN